MYTSGGYLTATRRHTATPHRRRHGTASQNRVQGMLLLMAPPPHTVQPALRSPVQPFSAFMRLCDTENAHGVGMAEPGLPAG